MPEMISSPTAAAIAYQDLEKALRSHSVWEVVEGLVEEVRDTMFNWGYEAGWEDYKGLRGRA